MYTNLLDGKSWSILSRLHLNLNLKLRVNSVNASNFECVKTGAIGQLN